jgi:hypothetical protein
MLIILEPPLPQPLALQPLGLLAEPGLNILPIKSQDPQNARHDLLQLLDGLPEAQVERAFEQVQESVDVAELVAVGRVEPSELFYVDHYHLHYLF